MSTPTIYQFFGSGHYLVRFPGGEITDETGLPIYFCRDDEIIYSEETAEEGELDYCDLCDECREEGDEIVHVLYLAGLRTIHDPEPTTAYKITSHGKIVLAESPYGGTMEVFALRKYEIEETND